MVPEKKTHKIASYTVPNLSKKTRFQDLSPGMFQTIPTKSAVKKAIKKGLILINNTPATTGQFLIGGEVIDLYQNEKNSKPTIEIKIEVLFEDEYLAIINKPAGITVSGNKKWTLENALPNNLTKCSLSDALLRPEPIHRLDHPTSGILLIGKTSKSVIQLNKLFEEKNIQKKYVAISVGQLPEKGIIKTAIDGKNATTQYTRKAQITSEKFTFLNLVELSPITGRKHQLRKHLSSIGSPILGDKDYGKEGEILFGNGLYLHAFQLSFIHPFTKEEILVDAPTPKKFQRIFDKHFI